MKVVELIQEEVSSREKFQSFVRKAKLYHVSTQTTATSARRKIKQVLEKGFRAGSYWSFQDPAWGGDDYDVTFVVNGADVVDSIYPDPEQLLDVPKIKDLKLPQVSFKTVTKKLGAETLYDLFFEYIKQEGFDEEIAEGSWLFCKEAIPAEHVKLYSDAAEE